MPVTLSGSLYSGGKSVPLSGSLGGGSVNLQSKNNVGSSLQLGGNPFTPGANLGSSGVGSSSSSTSGGGYTAPTNPYSAVQTQFLNELPTAISNIVQSGKEAFTSGQRSLQGSAEKLYNSLLTGQKSINTARENVELNRLNGIRDIMTFVRNGLQSGSTQLSNMNALDSSGADSLARAYSSIGNDKARGVGNQAFLQNRDINTQQDSLNMQREQGLRDMKRARDETVDKINSQVRSELMKLDQQAKGLDLSGKVAVDQQKQKIIDGGVAKLNAVDAWLNSHLSGVNPESQADIQRAAAGLQTSGFAGSNPFDTNLPGGGLQLTGPALDQLPIYLPPPKSKQNG